LILGLLYVYLAFVPTGNEEQAKATRAAAREVLASRLGSQGKDVSLLPAANTSRRTIPPPVTTATLPTAVSSEEALFWEDAWTKFSNWESAFPPTPFDGRMEIMRADFGDLDIAAIEKRVKTKLRNSESPSGRYWENQNRERTAIRLSWITLQESWEEKLRIQTGITMLQQMNETEQRIFRKTRDGVTTETWALRILGDQVNPFTYLAFYRKLRNGNPEEITRWIERCVQHYGESILLGQYRGQYPPEYDREIEEFEELLSWMALQPKVPEEALDSVAAQLASWKLTPEEYRVLRTASFYEKREWQFLLLKETGPEKNSWHYFLSGTPEKVVSRLAEPLLIRALDRQTEALIQLDVAGYGAAQKARKLAIRVLNFSDEDQVDQEELFKSLWEEEKKQPDAFNRSIAMTRFAFASARYRREHGRYPDSVTDLIPRYLDESFAPTSDRLWFIFKPEPFTALILPSSDDLPSSATQVLINYAQAPENKGKIPKSVDDLKPYAAPGTDLAPLAPCFVRIDECPVYGLVVRNAPILEEEKGPEAESGTDKGAGGTGSTGKDSQYPILFGTYPAYRAEDSVPHAILTQI
jgi:hypothetical protein